MDVVNWHLLDLKSCTKCPVCGFVFSRRSHGKPHHYRKHVREGTIVEIDHPIMWWWPPGFFLPEDAKE
jgi:hypothetical protein